MSYNEKETYLTGELIQKMRKERGITQEQLCDGLCSISTLSRIEAGKIAPRGYLFHTLMQRLGYHPEKYYSIYVGKESYAIWRKRDALNDALIQRNQSAAEDLIYELSQNKFFVSGLGLQFMLNSKAALLRMKNPIDHEEVKRLLNDSLRITIPHFHEKYISRYMLSYEEIKAINMMGNTYAEQNEYERASQLFYNLKESIEEFCLDEDEKSKMYPSVIYSASKLI